MKYVEKRLLKIFNVINDRLPSTYPKAKLIIHSNLKKLEENYWGDEEKELEPGDPGDPLFAFCNINDFSIHIAYCLNYETLPNICWYLLHEIGHLQAIRKYGEEDIKWCDYKTAEKYANEFADRWVKKIKKEGIIYKI